MIKNYKKYNESLDKKPYWIPSSNDIIYSCIRYGIKNYTINDDMSIDVNDDVNLSMRGLDIIPLRFNKVSGRFDCSCNDLISLDGSPKEVGDKFDCNYNTKLSSLKGSPNRVNGLINLNNCNLQSLEDIPLCNGSIFIVNNNINSFKGISEFWEGYLGCNNNPIYEIYLLFNDIGGVSKDSRYIYWLNEYDVIQGNNIIMDRLEEVFLQLDRKMPNIKNIEGYNLIH